METEESKAVTDPVCGMTFRVEKAAASVLHDGRLYYFCAYACHKRFLEDPDTYARPKGN